KAKVPGGPEKANGVTWICEPKHWSTGTVVWQAKTSPETCWTLPVTVRANGNTCPLATLAGAGVAQVAVTLGKLRVTGTIKLLSAPGAVKVTVPVKGLCAAVSPVTPTATATGCDKPPPTGPVVGV